VRCPLGIEINLVSPKWLRLKIPLVLNIIHRWMKSVIHLITHLKCEVILAASLAQQIGITAASSFLSTRVFDQHKDGQSAATTDMSTC
jgi:hypothetical protein